MSIPTAYEIRHLTLLDLDESYELQTIVHEALEEDKKLFILEKTKEQMAYYISEHVAYGLFMDGKLVSQVYYALLDKEGNVDTQIELLKAIPQIVRNRELVAMPKAAETHPDMRGHGCLSALLDYSFDEMLSMGRVELFTDFAAFNEDSISVFMKKGMMLILTDHTPGDIELSIGYNNLTYSAHPKVITQDFETVNMFDFEDTTEKMAEGLYPTVLDKSRDYKVMPSKEVEEMLEPVRDELNEYREKMLAHHRAVKKAKAEEAAKELSEAAA